MCRIAMRNHGVKEKKAIPTAPELPTRRRSRRRSPANGRADTRRERAGGLSAVMTTLAGVTTMIAAPLEEIVARYGPNALPRGATIIYIAGIFQPSTVEFVTDLRRRDHHVVALYVGEEETPEVTGLRVENYCVDFMASERADV